MNKIKSSKKSSTAQAGNENIAELATIKNASAIDHALDAVNVADVAVSFINANIRPVMTALIELSKCDSMDVSACKGRLSLINDLARLGWQLVDEAAASMESDQDEMHSKLALLQGAAA